VRKMLQKDGSGSYCQLSCDFKFVTHWKQRAS
jgi:hypothetical protein